MRNAIRALGQAILVLALLAPPVAARDPEVRELGRVEIGFADPPGQLTPPRVNRPYFDAQNRLRWDDAPIHGQATGSCDTVPSQTNANGFPIFPRMTRMLAPRVDERRCPVTRPDGRVTTEITLIGLDAAGRVTWQRTLGFQSGAHLIDQQLVGATRDGLVLSSLEVWSPETGETLLPAPARPVGPEARPVPRFQVMGSALYLPARREFLVFEADVTLTRRQGGLYRVRPDAETRELTLPVTATISGAHDRVESMATLEDGRHAVLAQRRAFRGPSSVSVAVLNPVARRLVFRADHGKACVCADPVVVVGRDGHVGFSYRDDSARRHVLVHYRIVPPGRP